MMRTWTCMGDALTGEIASCRPARGELAAWYIGQVGFVFKGEATVCVDPFLNDLVENGVSLRLYPPPFAMDALLPDYVVCTHGHADHMAVPTLCAMASAGERTRFLVPAGCVDELARAGVPAARIIPMKAHQVIELPGLTVRPVQAAHPIHEVDTEGRDLALCVSLAMNGVEIMHLGDTYLTDQLVADLTALPAPDAFFAPVNGTDYFRTAQGLVGNLSPVEAARLAVLVHARVAVPTHFDLIAGNTCDPLPFVQALWEAAPAARFRIPALGEELRFRA